MPGFLPFSRGSTFMLDLVALAMIAILPALSYSIYIVRIRRNYLLHKRIQITLGVVLLVAVALFELEMRMAGGWRILAKDSPYFGGLLDQELKVHLFFAISTTALWIVTMVHALRRFASPPAPGPASRLHVPLARVAAGFMYMTAVTGWTFYWLAFVAR